MSIKHVGAVFSFAILSFQHLKAKDHTSKVHTKTRLDEDTYQNLVEQTVQLVLRPDAM